MKQEEALQEQEDSSMSRRTFVQAAASLAAITAMASDAFARNFSPDAEPVRYPEPDVVPLDPRFKYKLGNTPILRLHRGTLWAEGPAWNGVGRYLLWSDIPSNEQLRWIEEDGHVSRQFRYPSGNSNGNTFDYQGRQIACEHGNRRVVRYEYDGTITVLADSFDGKPFNAPNDAVVHPNDGGIWFTDPGYGSLMNYEGHRADTGSVQPFQKEAIYRIDAQTGDIAKVTDEIYKPNGLCFSHDYTKLYAADTGASHYPGAPQDIKVWDIDGTTSLKNTRQFTTMEFERQGRLCRRHPGGRRRQHLGQRRLGRRRLRRRAHLRPQRRPHRPHPPARNLLQRVLRRHQAQPPVHDRQPVAVRRLR